MEPEHGWYRFVHSLVREALLHSARDAGRLARWHRTCVDTLRGSGRGAPSRLGPHLVGAGAFDEGARALLQGARRAVAIADFRGARQLLQTRSEALDALALGPEAPERVEGWVLLARSYEESGLPQLAAEWVRRVRDAGGDPGVLEGDVALALGDFEAAATAFRAHVDTEPVVAYLGLSALSAQQEGEGALAYADEAYAAAVERGDRLGMARAVAQRATCLLGRGDWMSATSALQEAVERFEMLGHRRGVARCLLQIGMAARLAQQRQRTEDALRAALQRFVEVGDPLGELRCLNGLGELLRDHGDLEGAERHYRRAIRLAGQVGAEQVALVPTINLALVLIDLDRVDDAQRVLDEVARALSGQRRLAILGVVQVVRAAAAAMQGEQDEAVALLAEGETLLEQTGRLEPDVVRWAERAAEHLGDEAASRRARALAQRQRERMGTPDDPRDADDR